MALFGRKKTPPSAPPSHKATGGHSKASEGKDEKKEAQKAIVAPLALPQSDGGSDLSHVLKNPRITEKATMHQATGVYTFDVADSANKQSIARAIASIYKVIPHKIRIVTIMSKQKRNARTGKRGVTRGGKKAYVDLKKGEAITAT